jgi:hypothetical protein
MGSQSNTKTDPEPESIHEARQEANEGRMVDNVYSGNTAETPIKTAIPAPDVPHVLAFRQTISNWFGVAVSFQLTLWMLCVMMARRWNITAFLRDVERNHKPHLFRSQEAAWRFMVADYSKRGPVLDAIPPEKRAQAVEREQSVSGLVSDRPAKTSPVANQREHSPPSAGGLVSNRPAKTSPVAKGPPCSPDRVLELLAEHEIDNDIGFLAWVPANKRCEWPTDERNVRALINRYVASLDRNRSSASSDAASSKRASSDTSAGGLTTPVSDADLSPGDTPCPDQCGVGLAVSAGDKSGVKRVWSGGSPGEPDGAA